MKARTGRIFGFGILSALWWSAFPSIAEEPSSTSLKVEYNARIPAQIRRAASTLHATRFYSVTTLNAQKVALHFYNSKPPKKLDDDLWQQTSRLDVFVEKHRIFEKVSSTPVTEDTAFLKLGKPVFQMEMLHLDAKTQTVPLVKIRITRQASSGEMIGDDVLFTFPKGIHSSAVAQIFGFYYLSGPSGASSNTFDATDERGFLTVLQRCVGGSGRSYTAWKWNGEAFAEHRELKIGHDHPYRYKWNGEELVRE